MYKDKEAITYLRALFGEIMPDTLFRVCLYGKNDPKKTTVQRMNVSIAGFSEERRKKQKKLDKLTKKTGSVFLYGEDQPDHFLILKSGRKTTVFPLDTVEVSWTGFAGSRLSFSSDNWKNASSIDIFLKNTYIGKDAFDFFKATLLKAINNGIYTARMGKWVGKKSYSRDLPKEVAERMALEEALKTSDAELLKTMVIGADIQNVIFTPGNPDKDVLHTINTVQRYNTTPMQFRELIIESDTFGKEIGSKHSKSTYVYLLGTSFHAPSNLLIIRHRQKPKVQD